MDVLLKLVEQPAVALMAGGLALGVLVVIRALQRVKGERREIPGLDKMLAAGRYQDAAMLCMRNERYAEAQELFLRAQQPARAAQIAARLGNHRLAGELYERAGDLHRAAAAYERAGMAPKAQELTAAAGPSEHAVRKDTPRAKPGETSRRASPSPRPASAVADAMPSRKPPPGAEVRFRALLAKGASDDASKLEMQQVAQQAAEEALAAGEIRKAAEIYRDAGLHDEAIHLFVNVLGVPGEAAALLSARGHHDRAAELYELAGMKERAAVAWAECARKDGRVEQYIDRVERLEPQVACKLLEEATAARPVGDDTAEIYYRFGRMLDKMGERVRALEVMTALRRGVGSYRDVAERIHELEGSIAPSATRLAGSAVDPHGATMRSSPIAVSSATPTRGPSAPEALVFNDSQPQPTTVVVQNIQMSGELNAADMQALAREAMVAASVQGGNAVLSAQGGRLMHGLESAPVSLELLADEQVRAARKGMSLDALRAFMGSGECDLSNIEVYYRMGLVCLAGGDWNAALRNFECVEGASPGYRDAQRRADEIRKWQRSMGGKITLGGTVQLHGAPSSRYELRGELGRGGMAVVYRATDSVLDRDVALKFIAENSLEKTEFREMFMREARSVAQLNHPNIVTIYDVGSLEGRTFIAMEFVEGKTVDDMIVEQKRLTIPEALRVTSQVLAALEYAHGRQIVHRDIKPSNMMHSPTGAVKLMDFGLAKSLTASTKLSMVAGTPAYMPPEQFAGRNVDHRADLYAVGASLYEMLTGELPFEGYVRTGPAPSARARVPEVPAAIDEALRTVMDPDPAKRFQSAKDFAAPILRVLAVIERAVDERAARNSTPELPPVVTTSDDSWDPPATPQIAQVTRPARPARNGRAITAVMEEPSPRSQSTPSRPRNALTTMLEEPQLQPPTKSTKPTLLTFDSTPAPAQRHASVRATAMMSERPAQPHASVRATAMMSATPPQMPSEHPPARAASSVSIDSAELPKPRKGTLLMHASSDGTPVARPSADVSYAPSNRSLTRPQGYAAAGRRSVSSIPPPA